MRISLQPTPLESFVCRISLFLLPDKNLINLLGLNPDLDRFLHPWDIFPDGCGAAVSPESESDYQEDLLKNPRLLYVRISIIPMLLLPARLPTCLICPI